MFVQTLLCFSILISELSNKRMNIFRVCACVCVLCVCVCVCTVLQYLNFSSILIALNCLLHNMHLISLHEVMQSLDPSNKPPSHHSQHVFFVSSGLVHHAEQASVPGGVLEALIALEQ